MEIVINCPDCQHEFAAAFEETVDDCIPVHCPNCGNDSHVALPDPRPVHLVVSLIGGTTYIKPNRPVPLYKATMMLKTMLIELEKEAGNYTSVLDPKHCSLNVFLTVDEEGSDRNSRVGN